MDYLTNETLYNLKELPGSLIILGGGVDGLEYASAFGRLGVKTIVVEASPRLLPAADAELVRTLTGVLKEDGIRLIAGTQALSVRNQGGKIVVSCRGAEGQTLDVEAQKLLVAVGRKPDLEALSLEKAGIAFTARGIVTDRKLRTSAPHIYACGDIAGPFSAGNHGRNAGHCRGDQRIYTFEAQGRLPQQHFCCFYRAAAGMDRIDGGRCPQALWMEASSVSLSLSRHAPRDD